MSESQQDPTTKSTVSLREITNDTVVSILKLSVSEHQERFVASNAVSIAQAHFQPECAWFRAIYADDTPVGFVLLEEYPKTGEYGLWRYMIDQRYQKLGFGRRALELVIQRVRTLPGATEFLTSVVEGEGSPLEFYKAIGFRPTGEYDNKEAILRLPLQ